MVIDDKTYLQISSEKTIDKIINGNKNTKKNKKSEIILTNPKQQEVLRKYVLYCKQDGNAIKTISTKIKILKHFCLFVKKDLKKVRRKDIENYLDYYTEKGVNNSTLDLYKIHIKSFFKWLYKSEDYPEIVKWLKRGKSKSKEKEILTREEVKKLLQSALSTRDKCLISLLYDAALRLGEATNIRLKDIDEDNYGFKIKVDGKTGVRRIRLVNSVPALRRWINDHPFKEDKDSYLFICLTRQLGLPLGVNGAYKVIEKTAEKSKINKNIHPHLFRHTKLTHLAEEGFNEMDLRIFAGWSRSSSMPEVYLHNSERNVEDKILRKNGLLSKTEEKQSEDNKKVLKPRECPMCETLNDVSNKFCSKCGQILDVKVIKDIEKAKESAIGIVNDVTRQKIVDDLKKELLVEILREVRK